MSEIVNAQGEAIAGEDGISKFWDDYQERGIAEALATVRERSADNGLEELEQSVPYLVEEARNRGIDILKFLAELDEQLAKEEEQDDATGTDNGPGELHADSSDEADQSSNEDEPASTSDVDGEDREAE